MKSNYLLQPYYYYYNYYYEIHFFLPLYPSSVFSIHIFSFFFLLPNSIFIYEITQVVYVTSFSFVFVFFINDGMQAKSIGMYIEGITDEAVVLYLFISLSPNISLQIFVLSNRCPN